MALIRSGCPICTTALAACGGHPDVTPVDSPLYIEAEAPTVANRLYEYADGPTTVRAYLSEKDAERLGATPYEPASAGDADADSKAADARTKVRKSASNKSG